MKLNEAMVCVDCDCLYSFNDKAAGACCPDCGSQASAALWTWLPGMREGSLRLWLERKAKIEASVSHEMAA